MQCLFLDNSSPKVIAKITSCQPGKREQSQTYKPQKAAIRPWLVCLVTHS